MLGYNVDNITLLRYYTILLYMSLFFAKLLPYYLISLLHDYLRIFFYTLLPCYSATCVSSIMSTLLPYYAITRVCSLESYHLITLLRYYTILCECFLYVVSLLRCYARFLADSLQMCPLFCIRCYKFMFFFCFTAFSRYYEPLFSFPFHFQCLLVLTCYGILVLDYFGELHFGKGYGPLIGYRTVKG